MRRTYVAAIAQRGPSLSVTLSGATFAPAGIVATFIAANAFNGKLEQDRAVFDLHEYEPWWTGPDVVEQIGPGRFLSIDGRASVELPTTRGTGTLSGSFKLLASNPWSTDPPLAVLGECFSDRHRFSLSR